MGHHGTNLDVKNQLLKQVFRDLDCEGASVKFYTKVVRMIIEIRVTMVLQYQQ